MLKRIYFLAAFIFWMGSGFYGFAQDVGLARSSPDYMVTPGDVYTLTFVVGGNLISHTIVVGTDYRIRVVNLGVVNGRGRTFVQVRNQVEAIVTNNHPLSGPQLILTQPAVFRVFVDGEVYSAGERSAWGLTRLSSLVDDNLTRFASTRNVTIRSVNGQTRVFDLFQFWRRGEQGHNPHLRPGDVVTFNRVQRLITIQGEVERPGTYQLLAGENLRQLIELYGNGLMPRADLSRITLTRFVGSEEISGDIIPLTAEDIAGNFALQHMDIITIPSIGDFRPAVPVERRERSITITGAVRRPGTFELMPHENLRELIEVYGDGLTPLADLTRMTLRRYVGGDEVSGDIILLTAEDIAGNFALQHLDVISISDITDLRPLVPVERVERTITISGAVRRPGTFELMQHENLRDLIEVYGDGLTPLADLSRMRLTRFVGSREISGDIILLTEEDIANGFALQHLDVITIPDITDFRPLVPVERVERTITISGAVRRPGTFELMQHENLRELIEVYGDGLTPLADLTRIRLTRFVGGREISGDIILLSEEDIAGNFALNHLDVITIPDITDFRPLVPIERVERTITIIGAVRTPGTFELMQHENLRELIEVYGGGLSPLADASRVEIVRRINTEDISGNRLFLTLADLENDFSLEHYDTVIVPSISDLLPVLFVEGAVGIDITAALVTTNRVTARFYIGETYASMVRRNPGWFSAVSDLENAYVIRHGGEIIPLNLNLALFDVTYRGEVPIQNLDTLVIPFRQFFVTVAGAVMNPGRFPFIPDRGWEYYVALAGGFMPTRNIRDSIIITDVNGRRLSPTDPITPEAIIMARTNHPLYFFNQYAPVITTVLSIVSTLITAFLLVGNR